MQLIVTKKADCGAGPTSLEANQCTRLRKCSEECMVEGDGKEKWEEVEGKRVQRRREKATTLNKGPLDLVRRQMVRLNHKGEGKRTWHHALFWLGNLVEGTRREVN
jgi:hypothetical protein